MARTAATRPEKAVARPVARGVHGRQMHNKILLVLPNDEYQAIFSKLEFVSLPTPTVLNEVAAGILEKAGLITHTRGAVKIESRTRLEAAACECYGIMTGQIRRWHSEAS